MIKTDIRKKTWFLTVIAFLKTLLSYNIVDYYLIINLINFNKI